MSEEVKVGDNISVHYTGKLKTGEQFDSSVGREPLTFVAGAGQMIKGFDKAVIGMKKGDKKTITITPEEGYGVRNEEQVVEIKKEQFGDEFDKLKVGVQISGGQGLSGRIIEIKEDEAIVDFNHFLAGKTLIFDLELVSINK